MGNSDSKNLEKQTSNKIDKEIEGRLSQDRKIVKMLVLGAGESGKSTIIKQLTFLFGGGYQPEKRKLFLKHIRSNILESMQILVLSSDQFPAEWDCKVRPANLESKKVMDQVNEEEALGDRKKREARINEFSKELIHHIKTLWKDEGIQKCFREHRSELQIPDTAAHFLDSIDSFHNPDYIPSEFDILYVRTRSTGIVRTEFNMFDRKFEVFDVGGQVSERKKWILCFDGCQAMVFVVASSEYNQKMFEDDTQNRVMESLNLFQNTVNNPVFNKATIILFFNKVDIFIEKIKDHPLRTIFPDYTGDSTNPTSNLNFLKEQFLSRIEKKNRKIFVHFISATDRENLKETFIECNKNVLKNAAV